MLARVRILARGLAATAAVAVAGLAGAGCPSLDALECHGAACADGLADDGGVVSESGATHDRIFCGGDTTCARTEECCFAAAGGTSCTSTSGCGNGTDIFCDDPSQCPGGSACWICINGQGFQGTSCDYQGDIVGNDKCDQSNALVLCHSSSQCEGGTTCKPLGVPGLDPGDGSAWFTACQP